MASAIEVDTIRVTLTKDDLDALRRNDVLAVPDPRHSGVIALRLATCAIGEHTHGGVTASPLITGKTVDRLKAGETVRYGGAKLEVRLAPEEVND